MSGRRSTQFVAASIAFWAFALGGFGCSDSYDWNRPDYERGTLGEELFSIWRKDAARAPEKAEPRVEMLDGHREGFVTGVDRMAPPEELEAVDEFLRTTNESVDSGLLPSFTRKIRVGLEDAAADSALRSALASDSAPSTDHYLADASRPNLPVYLLNYDEIRPAAETLGGALLASDGVDAEGRPAPDESTAFVDAQRALARHLAGDSSGEGSLAVDLRDVLLREDGRLQADRDISLPAVRYDRRGHPKVTDLAPRDPGFRPVSPFVDRDADGLADVDKGRFVLQQTDDRDVEPFSDSRSEPFEAGEAGRALSSGAPAFEYVNLADTGLHWTTRRTAQLHEKNFVWNIVDGAPALLGERIEHDSPQGTYRGYGSDQPLLDVLHSGYEMLNFDALAPALRSLARFLDGHSLELARLLDAFGDAKSAIDAVPDAQLSDDSTIGYDLIPILEETAKDPKLWADLMDGLREPVVAETGTAMATLLRFRDLDTLPDENGSYEGCFQQCKSKWESRASKMHPHGIGKVGRFECIRTCAIDELFTQKTDFDAPEAEDNRSANQQLFHLLRDTAGVTYTMKIERASLGPLDLTGLPPIIELPGAAEAFVATIAGNLKIKNHVSQKLRNDPLLGRLLNFLNISNGDVAGLLSTLSGLFGAHLDAEPTPDQVTRLFNQPDLQFEVAGFEIDVSDPVCKDGYVMANHHADKLFASEASGLIDAVQPLAKAYSDHDREELFTALFEVIHEHYSSHDDLYKTKDGSISPMKGANLVSYEPALLKIARSGYLFEALQKFAVAVDRMKPKTGEPFDERLRQLVYNAVRMDRPIQGPNGEKTLTLPDGTKVPADTDGTSPSRMHYLLYSVGELVDSVDAQPKRKKKLKSALATLTEVFVETGTNSRGQPAFERPGTVALLSLGTRQLADSAEQWRSDGVLDETLAEDAPEATADAVTSRMLPAILDLVRELGATSERRSEIDALLAHVLDNPEGRDQLAAAAYQMLASTAGAEPKPAVGDFLGGLIDPGRTWEVDGRENLPLLSHALTLVHRLNKRDDPGTGFAMARRGLATLEDGRTAAGAVGEVVGDYYRDDPASDAPYDAADYRRVFLKLAAWIDDDVHGLEQLYDLIGRRAGAE